MSVLAERLGLTLGSLLELSGRPITLLLKKATALYFLGEANYQQEKKPQAIAAYDRLVKEQPKSELRDDALYALGVAQEELGKYPEAGAAYDLFLKDYNQHELATEVRMRKAETVLQAGDFATYGEEIEAMKREGKW